MAAPHQKNAKFAYLFIYYSNLYTKVKDERLRLAEPKRLILKVDFEARIPYST